MCAHPRVDPATGEMVLFRYDLTEPYLSWGVIGADGSVTRPLTPIDVGGSYMIHDFVLTRSSVVLFVAPAQFDLQALMTGSGPPLAWHGDQPLRIAVVARDTGAVRWIETDPFWVYHFANGFDDGDDIVVDLCRFGSFALSSTGDQTGAAARVRLDVGAGTVTVDPWDDQITEFPRIDDRMHTQAHRFFNYSSKSPGLGMGHFNVLNRVDTTTGAITSFDCGTKVFDEVVFAPAQDGDLEQGYYVAFRTDLETLQSDWAVWDASDITVGPVATVEMPFRVPSGLHGNWFPA
jgi:carotenoid cleavage dioxygenase